MLTNDQDAALVSIDQFLTTREGVAFLLEGGAGVGKTFLLGQLLHRLREKWEKVNAGNLFNPPPPPVVCVAAPTHKAIGVLRRKLDAFRIEWCLGYDDYTYNGTDVITGTTASLLGIRPVITEDQTSSEVKFGKTNRGILSKVMPSILVIDEVSMLGKVDFLALRETLKEAGSKIIAVGDRGQLPPVKQEAVPFEAFKNHFTVREIVRQATDSAIVQLAWAIRDGLPWHAINGKGITRTDYLAEAYIEQLDDAAIYEPLNGKKWLPEEARPVFIAYTNRRVNEIQDAACMKMYGHGRLAFAPGELVLSEVNFYRDKVMLCANQDELIVDQFMSDQVDPTCGIPVVLHHHSDPRKGKFTAHYLAPEDLRNGNHPYNVEKEARRALAEGLQEETKRARRAGAEHEDIDRRRKQAWRAYFEWRDQTVISFRHPFSITSHKSQGSTYKGVFADTSDLARFSIHALYVAVTRPKDDLFIPRLAG